MIQIQQNHDRYRGLHLASLCNKKYSAWNLEEDFSARSVIRMKLVALYVRKPRPAFFPTTSWFTVRHESPLNQQKRELPEWQREGRRVFVHMRATPPPMFRIARGTLCLALASVYLCKRWSWPLVVNQDSELIQWQWLQRGRRGMS